MKCAVLGDPIAHSLSPVLHRAAYAELGLDWTYEAIRVASGGLTEFLMTVGDDVRGLSLTMPLKREVMGLVQQVSEIATMAGAANTLIHDEGVFYADNTDLPGAMAALAERYDGPVGAVTILGAGATAASTGLAMAESGAESITVVARSEQRAEETLRAISRHRSHPDVRVALIDDVLASGPGDGLVGDIVISTVPAEAQTEALVDRCARFAVVFEALYDPWPTPLAATAPERGQALVGGLDLLLHQAAYQVLLFTGSRAPLDVMRNAGQEALTQRSAPSTPRSAPRSSGR